MPDCVATGFPLPSTGRGIEGEGWSYPELPPVRFFLYQPPPGSRLNTSPENPRINTFITMNERLQTRVARATGPYRPATRRTERVRRSFCQRTPFVIGASSFFRHSTFVIPKLKPIKKPRNITFYALKLESTTPETSRPHANPWAVGRATPCAPLLTSQRTRFPQPPPSQCFSLKKLNMQVPVFTICYTAANVSNPAGRVATSLPLPSTAPQRGEGLRVRGVVISRAPSRASLRWWAKSRCDFVCLRSRHFVAWLRRGACA